MSKRRKKCEEAHNSREYLSALKIEDVCCIYCYRRTGYSICCGETRFHKKPRNWKHYRRHQWK